MKGFAKNMIPFSTEIVRALLEVVLGQRFS